MTDMLLPHSDHQVDCPDSPAAVRMCRISDKQLTASTAALLTAQLVLVILV